MSTKSRFEKQLVVNHRTPSNSPITQKPVSAAPRCSGPGPSDDSSGAGRIRREPSKRPCRRQRDTSDSNSAPRRYSSLFYRRNGKVSISLSSSAVCVTPLGKALLESGASPTVGVSVVDQRPSLVTPLGKALLESGASPTVGVSVLDQRPSSSSSSFWRIRFSVCVACSSCIRLFRRNRNRLPIAIRLT